MPKYESLEIFSSNLNRILESHGYSQAYISSKLGVAPSTVTSWCQGEKMPRMDKVESLAHLFNVSISDLIERQLEAPSYSPVAEYLQLLRESPETRVLLDVTRGMGAEEIRRVANMIEAFRGGGNNKTD